MRPIILIISDTIEHKVLSSCHPLIAAFFPGKKIKTKLDTEEFFEYTISIEYQCYKDGVIYTFEINNQSARLSSFRHEVLDIDALKKLILPGTESIFQILLKQAFVFFLTQYTTKIAPWGILTGMRPGKLIQRMVELSIPETTQISLLKDIYLVKHDKIELMQTVAKIQKPFLQEMTQRTDLAALYVSIPFCPSRCYYCSFPSNTLNHIELQTYMAALVKELELVGEMLNSIGLKVSTIYIGGGTPTILSLRELERVLDLIAHHVPCMEKLEYTVEAGRPDTLDQEKLLLLQQYEVNRISINPQSMQDSTLQRIGRRHTVADIYKCYKIARQNPNLVINMDIILGLPGEGTKEIEDTVNQVIQLSPDNITVHALALKRGSEAWSDNYTSTSLNHWQKIQKYVHERMGEEGYRPYYFYRQKYIVGNLENVGYAWPGKESHYNIAIIEERQNVFGVGAGSVNKILNLAENTHQNIYHPQDIDSYIRGYKDVHNKIRRTLQNKL